MRDPDDQLTPTKYGDLNDVLRQLSEGARDALRENFVGAYLQGSFAVGDADLHSDVDFLVVTAHPLSATELSAVQKLQVSLYALPSHWAQHLEGSYVPEG